MPSHAGIVTGQSGAVLQIDFVGISPTCENCSSGCALFSLARTLRATGPRCRLAVPAEVPVAIGTAVELELSSYQLLNAAFLAYGLPLGGLMAGAGAGMLLTQGSDSSVLAGGAIGLFLGVLASKQLFRAPALKLRL